MRRRRFVVQQAHAIDARAVSSVDHVGNFLEFDVVVGFHEYNSFNTDAEDVDEALVQVRPCNSVFVNLDFGLVGNSSVFHLDHDRLIGRRD